MVSVFGSTMHLRPIFMLPISLWNCSWSIFKENATKNSAKKCKCMIMQEKCNIIAFFCWTTLYEVRNDSHTFLSDFHEFMFPHLWSNNHDAEEKALRCECESHLKNLSFSTFEIPLEGISSSTESDSIARLCIPTQTILPYSSLVMLLSTAWSYTILPCFM